MQKQYICIYKITVYIYKIFIYTFNESNLPGFLKNINLDGKVKKLAAKAEIKAEQYKKVIA